MSEPVREPMIGNPAENIAGYQTQPPKNIRIVNSSKLVEEHVLRLVEEIQDNPEVDQRWCAIAFTHFQQGFMALNRAVFQPKRLTLPEDLSQHSPEHESQAEGQVAPATDSPEGAGEQCAETSNHN